MRYCCIGAKYLLLIFFLFYSLQYLSSLASVVLRCKNLHSIRTVPIYLAVPAFGGYSFSSTVNLGPHLHHSLSGTTSITIGTWSPQPNHEVLATPKSAKGFKQVTMMVRYRRPTYSKWGMYLSCTSCRGSDVVGTVY